MTGIHLVAPDSALPGQSVPLRATVDFEDQTGVDVSADPGFLAMYLATLQPVAAGSLPARLDDAQDLLVTLGKGPVLIVASNTASDGSIVRDVQVINIIDPATATPAVMPEVYPGAFTLARGGTRQLKVHADDPITQASVDIHAQAIYLSSNDAIATIDANGLVTAHANGHATIFVVYVYTSRLSDGTLLQQTIGMAQTVISVELAQLQSTPQAIEVDAETGSVVMAPTGETVMIPPQALSADTTVSIQRITLGDPSWPGTAQVPAQGVLEPLAAFKLELGKDGTTYPLQLAIPVQQTANPGDEVLFLRKGQVPNADGTFTDTWWIVDNGFVGADGIARTASPPFDGVSFSGEYYVMRGMPGVISGKYEVGVAAATWLTFGGTGLSIAGGLLGASFQSDLIDAIAQAATSLFVGAYHFGIPQSADVEVPQVGPGQIGKINTINILPPVKIPGNTIPLPTITGLAAVPGSDKVTLTFADAKPAPYTSTLVLRAILPDGSRIDIKTFPGTTTGSVTVQVPADTAVGVIRWQLFRVYAANTLNPSGVAVSGATREFSGNVYKITPQPNIVAVLSRTGVDFLRENKVVGQVNLLERLGAAELDAYLTGTKVQPIAFSDDFTRAYVGGNAVIYVIDTITFRIFQTIPVTGGKNITSLVAAGGKLMVGEGATSGAGAGNYQLRVVDIDTTSKTFRQVISVQGTGIEASVYGVAAMEIGPDGYTLIVAVPKNANSTQLGDRTKRGDVLIFDLTTLVMTTGRIAPAIVAALDGDGISGKSPQRIVATADADHYLVTNVADYSRGLSTLVLTRDSSGNVTSATLTAIDLSQPLNAIISDRLDIQRAQSVVMVVRDGVEYAIVSDDHYNFNDPYYRAMFEAPDFLYPPFGPPVAYGGSASAKKVSVGGKLGIIRDPFGKQGNAQYLGATLPLDGYGIINLSLSADGAVLVGQLKGGFGTVDPSRQNPNLVQSWSIDALLKATLAMSDKDRQSHHIAIEEPGEQNIPVKASPPAGTEISTGAETETKTSFITGSGLTNTGTAVNAMSLTIPGASHAQTYVTIDVDSTIAKFLKAGSGSEPLTSHTLVISAGGSATLSADAKTILEMYPGNALSTKTADELYGGQITVTTVVNGQKKIVVYQIVRWVNLTDAVAVLKMVDPNNAAFLVPNSSGTGGGLYYEKPDYAGVQFQNTLADGAGGQVRTKEVQIILSSSMQLNLSDHGASTEFGFGPGTAVTAGTASWTFDPDLTGPFNSGASSYSLDTLDIINADGTTIGSLNVQGKKTKQVVANLNFTGFKAEMVRIFTTNGLFQLRQPGNNQTGWYYAVGAAAQAKPSWGASYLAGSLEVSIDFWNTYGKFVNNYTVPAPGATPTRLQMDFDNAVIAAFDDMAKSMTAIYASMGNGITFIRDAAPGTTTWIEGPSVNWADVGIGTAGYVLPPSGLPIDTRRGQGIKSGWLDSVLQTGTPGAPAIPEMAKEWALTDAVNQTVAQIGNVSIGRAFDWGGGTSFGSYIASTVAHEFGHTFGLGEGYLQIPGVIYKPNAMAQPNLMNGGDVKYTRLGFTAEQQAILQSAVGVQPNATTSTGLTPLAATIAFYKQYYYLRDSTNALPSIPTTYVAPVGPPSTPSASPERFAVVPQATMLATQQAPAATSVSLTTEWTAHGDVDIGNGRLVVREAAGSQSRVGKVFIVGATDRFLRFTIDAASLQAGSGIPQDAFEALLLDAATGQSVAGAMALSRTDALLNLQGDGQAFLAQGVAFKINPDGSRTYLIDISGLPAGTAIALSFDILGFGALGSEVAISDIALMADPHAVDDALTTNEDAVIRLDVLGNDTSTAGSRVVVVTPPTHGTLTVRDDGSFDYTPDALWWGQDAFTYLLDNGKVQSNVATVSIDVRKVNHMPSASDASVSLQEDGSVAIDLSLHATDLDGDTLDYRIVDGPLHGSVVRQPDGTFLYVANPGFHGEDSFTFVANDGQSDSSVGTVRLQVQHVNHAPVAQDATLPSLEEQALDGNLIAWVTDRDGDALTVELVSGPAHGNLVLNPDGSFRYVPDALFRGQDVFTYRVSDGLASSAIATVTIVMAPVNHLPTADDFDLQVQGDGAVAFDPLTHAADVDGDTLGVIVVDAPSHGTLIRQTDGSYTYRPDTYYAGNDRLTFVVDDGTGRSQLATVTFTVLPLNHVASAVNDVATTDQGVPVVIAVLSNDSDIDNTTGLNANTPKAPNAGLTARVAVPPAHGTLVVNTDSTLTYTPNEGFFGTDTFAYVANDGELDSAVASVSITVRQTNHAPIAANDAYTTVQGQPLVFVPTSNDTDADGDRLRTIIVNGPVHGKLVWGSDGSLTYTADAGFVGTDTLTYQASDGKSVSNVATVRLTVSAANQAPVAVNDSVRVHNNQTARIDVLANDRDADGDALKATIVSAPKHGTLTKNADGTFSYSADCLFTGTDTFTYVVNDGKANSNIATVTVTVLGPNLPPLAFDDVVDVKQNGSVRIDPTANDWDINGDDLQAVLVCGPSHGSLSLNPDGTYTYTPDANWYGLDGFTYQAFDGQYRSNPAMVWIRVAHVNQEPVAAADAFTVRAGVATRLDVLANDSDVDGDSLTTKLASSPKNGTLTRNRDGSFSYTAKSGFVGTDTFMYVATDGALDSRPVTVSITVLAPNRAPVAKDDKATTLAGAAVRIDVLGNDTDADGDRLATLLVCAPSHGKLSLNADGSYTYTPDKGWYGTDSFSYRVTDGDAQSGVAMVSITVQKVNRAPTAQSASFQVQKDGSVRIDFDCLVNDPDGDALTLSLTNPSKGSLTRNRDGSYTYKPKAGFTGTDAFSYSVSDGKLTASASITLVVSKNPPRDNAMSIIVGASASAGNVQGGGYIVVNLGTSSQPVIDWTATAGTYPTGLGNTGWAALLGGAVSGIDLLVAQTGLVVRRD
ncbi:hypothetical protein XnspCFBP7698_00750 [Xanthomonas sp. CFBP 7698]|nr:hypothetical protein XnspCFBP7698_00750 [Xanthomonas sp. CFBP 7698]